MQNQTKFAQLFGHRYGNLETDRKSIANIFQKQLESSFSNPNNPDTVLPPTITPNSSLVDFPFTCEDLVKAIDEVHASSSSPDFSVPAIVFKKMQIFPSQSTIPSVEGIIKYWYCTSCL